MTETNWKILFGVVTAVVTFLLIQPEVQQYPIVLLVLGCINVALAAASPAKRVTPE